MKISKFLTNKVNKLVSKVEEAKAHPVLSEDSITMRKGNLLEERYDGTSDPLVAERFSTVELGTFLSLYSSYPWVYVCANAIATASSSVPFMLLKKDDGEGEELKNADEFAPYLNKPNPNMTWHELMETTMLHLELSGNAYWEIVNDNKKGNGKILAIFPLRPDRMKIVPDAKRKIKRYESDVATNDLITYNPYEIIHLKYTDAKSEFYVVPAISAIKNEITLDFNATTWNKKFFERGAEPGGVLHTEKSLTETAYNRLRQNWYKRHRGADKSHEIAILEEGLKYQQVTSKHADMQYFEMKAWCRDTVLSAMRVPAVIIGIQQKLSVGTERDQKKVFWHNNIIPKLRKIQHIINSYLMPEGIEFKFNIKAIDSIIKDGQVKTGIVQSNINHGVMTINEARKKYYGMDPVEWGDTWWRPVGLVDVNNPVVAVPAEPGTGSKTGSPTGQRVTSGDKAGTKGPSQVPALRKQKSIMDAFLDIEKTEAVEPDWDNANSVKDYQEFMLMKSQAGPDEKKFRNVISKFFKEQADRILAELERDWPIQKDDRPTEDVLMDEPRENKLLYGAIIAMLYGIYKKYGSLLLGDIAPKQKFDTSKDLVREWIEKHAANLVSQVNSTTKQLIRNQLLQAYDNKESLQQIYNRLSEVLTGDPSVWRVFKIARTELLTLTNNARLEAAKQSGVIKFKRWVCALLPTSREREHGENHVGMHNTIVKMEEKFKAPRRGGGYDMMDGPGDTSAHPENRVNCLCYVSYSAGSAVFDQDMPKVQKNEEVITSSEQKEDMPKVDVHIHMPEGMIKNDVCVNRGITELPPQQIVKVENIVPVPEITLSAPDVFVSPPHIEIDVPVPQVNVAAPNVNIENNMPVPVEKSKQDIIVNVPAPIVNVVAELKMPETEEVTEVIRDERNRIIGSRKEIKQKDKEDKE